LSEEDLRTSGRSNLRVARELEAVVKSDRLDGAFDLFEPLNDRGSDFLLRLAAYLVEENESAPALDQRDDCLVVVFAHDQIALPVAHTESLIDDCWSILNSHPMGYPRPFSASCAICPPRFFFLASKVSMKVASILFVVSNALINGRGANLTQTLSLKSP
jgi:hypothetical protein